VKLFFTLSKRESNQREVSILELRVEILELMFLMSYCSGVVIGQGKDAVVNFLVVGVGHLGGKQ
jgi:hypothetical protein